MSNIANIVERLEKECGFKYWKSSSSKGIPHIWFKKKVADNIQFVSLWNKSNDPNVKDWTIMSALQSGSNCPCELSF